MSPFIGWICIGLAAAFAAWAWPFRRGLVGLTLNALMGVLGAVGAAMLGVAIGLLRARTDPWALPVAAGGALVLLVAGHSVWNHAQPDRRGSSAE
jgi:uncharacterized membrane protein YeaQ/YmgE (transglycosylase-associated protein family)